jgi:group I intron endonuclease
LCFTTTNLLIPFVCGERLGFFIMIGIYKITSPSKKVYIGQSINIEKRFKYYNRISCEEQPKLYNSLKKYGVENHIFEIICECEITELNELERYYQELYNCIKKGLNCMFTKSKHFNGKHSEETKNKMSLSSIGQKATFGFKGKNHSLESKTIMSKKAIGHKRCLGMKRNCEQIKNISLSKIGNKSKSKLVLDLETGIYYASAKETSFVYGYKTSTLTQRLSGIKKNNTQFIYV